MSKYKIQQANQWINRYIAMITIRVLIGIFVHGIGISRIRLLPVFFVFFYQITLFPNDTTVSMFVGDTIIVGSGKPSKQTQIWHLSIEITSPRATYVYVTHVTLATFIIKPWGQFWPTASGFSLMLCVRTLKPLTRSMAYNLSISIITEGNQNENQSLKRRPRFLFFVGHVPSSRLSSKTLRTWHHGSWMINICIL